jgi:TRAP transporter 4TM/12TM fusion protein
MSAARPAGTPASEEDRIAAAADALAHGEGESVQEPSDPVHRRLTHILGAALTATCLAWAGELPYHLRLELYREQFLAVVLGLGLALAFVALSWRGKPHARLSPVDLGLAAVALGAGVWIAVGYEHLLQDVSYRTPEIMALSAVVVLAVLEGLRRCTGWALLGVVLGFLAYALMAHLMPLALRGKAQSPEALLVYLGFDPSAVFGTPLVVGTTIVIMFLWLGEVLIRSGGGDFFKDIAMAAMGRRRGGPAKICVVGSGLFGMISGSAVSSVAAVGVFTIPMMKRTGYSARDAGAIEAVGSTGGQLMPPVMGAAAFLMAEFIEVPYAEIALAAAIPAVVYYCGLYFQVDLIAGRNRLGRLTDALPEMRGVLREGWHFIVPIAVLMVMMFHYRKSPELSAIVATGAMLAIGMVRPYRGKRLGLSDIVGSLAGTGRSFTDLILTLAAAGFVIGVLNATGLSYALTLLLVNLAGENLFVLLFVAGAISIVLGMGMPTTAVYVLLAALIAPAIVQSGVSKMAAHMFILYFGMLSMITPPVALAAFAAANISGAGAMETGWAAMRMGWVKYVLPFMFVFSPTLLMAGEPVKIAWDAATALVGVYYVTVGIVGFFRRDMGWIGRLAIAAAGAVALVPDASVGLAIPGFMSGAAVVAGGALLAYELLAARRLRAAGAE